MNTPFKRLLWLAGFLAIVVLIPLIYLLMVARLPTGYEAVKAQRERDVAELARRDALLAMAERAPAPEVGTAKPHPKPETPRQTFLRLWVQLQAAHTGPFIYFDFDYRMIIPQKIFYLTTEQQAALTGNPPESPAFRRVAAPWLTECLNATSIKDANPQYLVREAREMAKGKLRAGAMELLKLPAGAVPTIPQRAVLPEFGKAGMDLSSPMNDLTLAWLHGVTRDPAFDSVSALKRLKEMEVYARRSNWANEYYSKKILETTAQIATFLSPADNRSTGTLARRWCEALRDPPPVLDAATQGMLNRYLGDTMHEVMLKGFAEARNKQDTATYGYLFKGKLMGAVRGSLAPAIRRKIDLVSLAAAQGNQGDYLSAYYDLITLYGWGNFDMSYPRFVPPSQYLEALAPGRDGSAMMKLAARAWRAEHGRWPERAGDLAALASPAKGRRGVMISARQEFWMIDTASCKRPVLWQFTLIPMEGKMWMLYRIVNKARRDKAGMLKIEGQFLE